MNFKKISLVLVVLISPVFLFVKTKKVSSFTAGTVKSTLSSSQLSYFARLGAGNTLNSFVTIDTTANPSRSTNNLFVGDTVAIATGAGGTGSVNFVVNDIVSSSVFSLTSSLGNSNVAAGNYVVSTRSANHTIIFGTGTSITAGIGDTIQYLVEASSLVGETINDGMPDMNGFDAKQIGDTTAITCPVNSVATAVGSTTIISTNSYHVFSCRATAATGVGVSMIVGTTGKQLINPTRKYSANATEGDTTGMSYKYYVRRITSSATETTQGQLAVVEAVRIRATIDPTFSFTIGTNGTVTTVGNTLCGSPLSSGATNTTPLSANFGSVALSSFNNLAHLLSAVTNATGGYVVTVYETKPLTVVGNGITIPDTKCDSGTCSSGSPSTWATASNYGFGFGMQNIGASVVNPGTTTTFEPFGTSAVPRTIMANGGKLSNTETAYICYRLSVGPMQAPGNYENELIFTATATF